MSTSSTKQKFNDTQEEAARLRLSPRTLIRWRQLRKGPPFLRCGRKILYDPADTDAWLSGNRVEAVGEGAQ